MSLINPLRWLVSIVPSTDPILHRITEWGGSGWGTDYVVSVYPTPPHTIHPPHRIASILEESEIVFRRLRIHSNNIVSLLHGIVRSLQFVGDQSFPDRTTWPNFESDITGLW